MANRSYLYSIDAEPYGDANRRRVLGLSEWDYAIPLAYKLLVSENPCACRSMIWESEDLVAIIGDYQTGLRRLSDFLAEAQTPFLKSAADEAIRFLSDPNVQQPLILLESAEIFDLEGEDWARQNQALLQEIKGIGGTIEGFWRRSTNDTDQQIASALGLGGRWSNILYFEPESTH
jgi:hypothetical protein